ncbi:MAG: OmpA family protein [Prevotellaceae bacterium]|nr:OmpA family protein [Candidatus Faecinaster equi]
MHAYMTMYPQAKMEDLKKAFPNSLNPNSGPNVNFVYLEDKGPNPANSWDWKFFKKEDELLAMGDGRKVGVVNTWTKDSFERLASWARQYGIVIADFEAVGKGGEKGGFRLEYLNGYVPPKAKKGVPFWMWIIVLLLLVAATFGIFGKKKGEVQVVEKTVIIHDTLYVKQIEEIEKNFNAAEFVAGKADLSDDAKFVLHDLAKVLKKNSQFKLQIEGHTSAEGDATFNQKLSEERAAAAVTFLVEHEGVDKSRLEAVGYGSSRLKNAADPVSPENRRTEFVVVE